jgi:putative Mg2+ transporter-C (MgtC) family protein
MSESPHVQLLALVAGQGWLQIGELALAFALSSLIGLEREIRQKDAGLRTHTLVGVGAALFLLVSKYGFGDVVVRGEVVLDPSRVAAQIVSGIGFIGGGLIFVRRDSVQGLTTAAIVWVTAAIGMACAAGLFLLALLVTAAHFVVVLGFPKIARRLPRTARAEAVAHIAYRRGQGTLRAIVAACTDQGFAVTGIHTRENGRDREPGIARVSLDLEGAAATPIDLAASLEEVEGVIEVRAIQDLEAA